MTENSVIFECSYLIVFRMRDLPKKRKMSALNAGYHPVSLLHLHPVWNVLLPAKRDGDFGELRDV